MLLYVAGRLVECLAVPATEVDHHPHVELFHFHYQVVEVHIWHAPLMVVDVDEGILGAGRGMLRDDETGRRVVVFKQHQGISRIQLSLPPESSADHEQDSSRNKNSHHIYFEGSYENLL